MEKFSEELDYFIENGALKLANNILTNDDIDHIIVFLSSHKEVVPKQLLLSQLRVLDDTRSFSCHTPSPGSLKQTHQALPLVGSVQDCELPPLFSKYEPPKSEMSKLITITYPPVLPQSKLTELTDYFAHCETVELNMPTLTLAETHAILAAWTSSRASIKEITLNNLLVEFEDIIALVQTCPKLKRLAISPAPEQLTKALQETLPQ